MKARLPDEVQIVAMINNTGPELGVSCFGMNMKHKHKHTTGLDENVVHTARRTYRLNGPVKPRDCGLVPLLELDRENLSKPYHLEEGEVVTRFP